MFTAQNSKVSDYHPVLSKSNTKSDFNKFWESFPGCPHWSWRRLEEGGLHMFLQLHRCFMCLLSLKRLYVRYFTCSLKKIIVEDLICSLKNIIAEVFDVFSKKYYCGGIWKYFNEVFDVLSWYNWTCQHHHIFQLSILKSRLRGDFIMIKSAGCLSLTLQAGYFSRTFSSLTTLAGHFSTTLFISDPSK